MQGFDALQAATAFALLGNKLPSREFVCAQAEAHADEVRQLLQRHTAAAASADAELERVLDEAARQRDATRAARAEGAAARADAAAARDTAQRLQRELDEAIARVQVGPT